MSVSAASVYGRLRDGVKAGTIPGARQMDGALTAYAAESCMRRLQAAGMLDEVVLKGARLWSAWGQNTSRPTSDFDYSAQVPNLRGSGSENSKVYGGRVLSAIGEDVGDGLTIDTSAFRVSPVDSRLGGCAVEGIAKLHTAQVRVVVEIGFGHTLPEGATSPVEWRPTLKGVGEPLRVRAYTPEMWLAEKIRIALDYGEENTRLKDFFDMHALLSMPLGHDLLRSCLAATCDDFGVEIPASAEDAPGLSDEFAQRGARLWRDRRWAEWAGRPFQKGVDPELTDVVRQIREGIDARDLFRSPGHAFGR